MGQPCVRPLVVSLALYVARMRPVDVDSQPNQGERPALVRYDDAHDPPSDPAMFAIDRAGVRPDQIMSGR